MWWLFNEFFNPNCFEMSFRLPSSDEKELSDHDCSLSPLQRWTPICHLDRKIDFLINWAFYRLREPQILRTVSSENLPVCTHFLLCLKVPKSEGSGILSVKLIQTSGCFEKEMH